MAISSIIDIGFLDAAFALDLPPPCLSSIFLADSLFFSFLPVWIAARRSPRPAFDPRPGLIDGRADTFLLGSGGAPRSRFGAPRGFALVWEERGTTSEDFSPAEGANREEGEGEAEVVGAEGLERWEGVESFATILSWETRGMVSDVACELLALERRFLSGRDRRLGG